ncbi:MAG: S-layer homology domain-containing protein [Clostridia bacterium]|nr:S-layer homology domain-containing protein [Clostridia bacterium]
MKKYGIRIISLILTLCMLAGALPAGAFAAEKPDYGGTPDYAARYPNGVLEFSDKRLTLAENGPAGELKLIRRGGLSGEVSVYLKAVDVTARFGIDYTVTVEDAAFEPDPDNAGSLLDAYIREKDIITSDTEDEEYLALLGHKDPEPLSSDELAESRGRAIDAVAETLGVTKEQAAAMLTASPKSENTEEETPAYDADESAGYASELHALHDGILGKRTPANHSEVADITDPDTLLGDDDRNAAATAVNGKAPGATLRVTFKPGENEKRIKVTPADDTRYGAQKVFVLGLYDARGGAELGETFEANVVIREDEEPEKTVIGFESAAVTAEHGALYAEVDIVRSGCVDDYAAVTVKTVAGTAREGVDYLRVDGGSTFLPGETAKTVTVPLKTALFNDDTDRTFTLHLSAASENAEVTLAETKVTVLAGKAAKEAPLRGETTKAGGAQPVIIKGDDLAQKALDENWALINEGKKAYYSFSPVVTVGGSRTNSVPAGGEINFTGIARVEVVLEGCEFYKYYLLRAASPDYYEYGSLKRGEEYLGQSVYSSNGKTVTLSFDFSGYKDTWGDKKYLDQWKLANTYGISIVYAGSVTPSLFNNFNPRTYFTNLWSSNNFRTITHGPKIKEIRLYPMEIRLGVYDAAIQNTGPFNNAYRGGNNHPTSAEMKLNFRTYKGLTQVDETKTYSAGTVTVPEYVYATDPIYYTYNPSDEARRRGVYTDGFYRYAPSSAYNGIEFAYWNNKGDKRDAGYVLWNSEELPRAGFINPLNLDSFAPKKDRAFTVAPAYSDKDPIAYLLSPVLLNKDVGKVTVAAYDPNAGLMRVGGDVYNGVTLTRSADGFTWKEGDELYVSLEAKDGYYCGGVKITRANGSTETVPAGQRIILSDGMIIEPVFIQYNISLDLYWKELGTGLAEEMAENLDGYLIGYTYSGENDITFTNLGGGSYRFENLMPGKVLTLWAGPQEGRERDRTGLWLLEADDGRVRSDDGNYYLHVGDARAVTVDSKNMKMAYYLNPVDSAGGTVVSGQVCTKGIDIKHSTATTITARNAEQTATFLSGVTVSAVCLDPNATTTVRGKTYTTFAETDDKGAFSIYVPGGAYGCGITLSLMRDDVYRVISAPLLLGGGTLLIEMPAQDEHYQFDGVTLGQDTATDEIYLTDTQVNLGLHLIVDEGYSVQNVKLTSFDEYGNVKAEWFAEPVNVGPWNYSSVFTPSEKLVPGGKLTVEVIDKNGRSTGKVDTGYWIKPEIKAADFVLPQFDPKQSVTLPVIGDVSIASDLGSDNAKPDEPEADKSTLSSGEKSKRSPIEIKFGYGSKIKTAIKELKLIDKKGYAAMNATQRASAIRGKLSDLYGTGGTEKIAEGKMDKDAWFEHGSGKSAFKAAYSIGVYMSLYMEGMKFEFESLTLFASLTVSGSTTQQYAIAGVPVYLTLNSKTQIEGLVNLSPETGRETVVLADPNRFGWITDDLLEQTELGGFFMFTVGVSIEAGVGHPSIVAGGIQGTMTFRVGYEPWDQGAAIVDLGLSAVLHLGPIELPYKITSASYGIFRTDGYQDTTNLDFTKVKNKDRFPQKTGKKSGEVRLLSYDDGEKVTTVTAGYRQLLRPDSVDYGALTLKGAGGGVPLRKGEGGTPEVRVNSLNTCTPVTLPLGEGKWLLLALYDAAKRAANDCSALTRRVMTMKPDGSFEATNAEIVDNDGTFDSNLTAARLDDGRVIAVWSSAKSVRGDNISSDLGEMLNDTELKYCIFDLNGDPGEIKTLCDQPGCEEASRVARDPVTGKIIIIFSVTDYKTEGVTLGEDNLENIGNFLYNSYSTVCFKLLDENGNIITEYDPENESSYIEYETENNCPGGLEGLRYLDDRLSSTQSQAKTDQFTVGAIDGKAYVVYALDTDKDTGSDGDRELFLVTYDLTTMASSGPVRLTDDLSADVNPRLLDYNGDLLLFWKHEGAVCCADLSDPAAQTGISDMTEIILSDAAGAAGFSVEKDPHSGRIWFCWCGSFESEGTDGEKTARSAIFMRVFDKDFAYSDDAGEPLTGENGKPVSGAWGTTVPLVVATADNVLFSELDATLLGDLPLFSFKETTLGEDGEPEAYTLNYYTVDIDATFNTETALSPDFPAEGEQVTATVHAENITVLPAEKLNLSAELVSSTGATESLGVREYNWHNMPASSVTETFRFAMPEDPENWTFKLTAYDDDPSKGVTRETPLPCGPSAALDNVTYEQTEGTLYAVSLDVENPGNRALSGATLTFEKEPEDLLDGDGEGSFETLAAVTLPDIGAKDVLREYVAFDLPYDKADSDGTNVIWITVQGADGAALAKEEITLRQEKPAEISAAKSVTINGAESPADISVRVNTTTALRAAVAPKDADREYVFAYRTDDPGVATVDENGRVTALSYGTTTVYVDAYLKDDVLLIGADNVITSRGGTVTADEKGVLQYTAPEGDALHNSVKVTVSGASSGGGATVGNTATYSNPVAPAANGKAVTSTAAPKAGEKVTVTVTPNAGCEADSVKVTDANGRDIPVTKNADGTYSYIQPESDVTVQPLFKAAQTACPKDNTCPVSEFGDASPAAWYHDGVHFALEKGLMNGTGNNKFEPNGAMSRARVVTTLYRVEGEPAVSGANPFTDVESGKWYTNAVLWAAENKIVEGDGKGGFKPNASVTREQFAAILYRYAQSKGKGFKDTWAFKLDHPDAASVSSRADEAMHWCVMKGIINGKDGKLAPKGNATRAEVATMLMRYITLG